MANEIQQARQLTQRERLLPGYTRCYWVNDRGQKIWEPRILHIQKSWREIEHLSVVEGLRACCPTEMNAEELVSFANQYPQVILYLLNSSSDPLLSPYSNSCELHKNVNYLVMILKQDGKQQLLRDAERILSSRKKLGMFFGYPSCCCDFFQKNMNEKFINSTWNMALNTIPSKASSDLIEIVCAPETNTFLRTIGLRAVPHWPCSFSCDDTIRNGVEFMNIGKKYGFSNEMAWLKEVLSLPVQWRTLHGIEEIKTPLFKILTRTYYPMPKKYVIRATFLRL
jgi:hypothetical protein